MNKSFAALAINFVGFQLLWFVAVYGGAHGWGWAAWLVLVAMQAGVWALNRAWRADLALLAAGAVVSNGTDAPVENVSPVASYYATVSRKLDDGSLFYPDQRLSRLDALRTYTINAAYAAFEEDLKGSLTPGKLADITVLSKNILTVPEEEIPSTEVVYTIVGGRVMYQR